MILVQTRVGNGDHLTRTVQREGGVVGHTLNASNGPRNGVVDAEFLRRFRPQDSTVTGQMSNEVGRRSGLNQGLAHPSIARGFDGPKTNDVGGENAVPAHTQIRRGDDGQRCG